MAKARGEARRLITAGAIRISNTTFTDLTRVNHTQVTDLERVLTLDDLGPEMMILLTNGNNKHHIICVK